MSMADNKLIFQSSWVKLEFSTADSCCLELVSTLSLSSRLACPPGAVCVCFFFFFYLSPVLHTPGASSQLKVTQKSLRSDNSVKNSVPAAPHGPLSVFNNPARQERRSLNME